MCTKPSNRKRTVAMCPKPSKARQNTIRLIKCRPVIARACSITCCFLLSAVCCLLSAARRARESAVCEDNLLRLMLRANLWIDRHGVDDLVQVVDLNVEIGVADGIPRPSVIAVV